MKRMALYSSSRWSRAPAPRPTLGAFPPHTPPPAPPMRSGARWRILYKRLEKPALLAAVGILALLVVALSLGLPTPNATREEIEALVQQTVADAGSTSMAAKAYQVIRPSVVRVRGSDPTASEEAGGMGSVGSGVVIIEDGKILTNLHVVAGAERISVVFADGLESEAYLVAVHPDQDLAVIQARELPDDLVSATMASTADLKLGDQVIAVGFPFGIGPSVTAGVISGLQREYHSPVGDRLLTNLIQVDTAVNPGSSGGPLVTAQGELVGIVTGLLNPTEHSVFIGIGFAVPIEVAASAAGLPPF